VLVFWEELCGPSLEERVTQINYSVAMRGFDVS
jgi:hypothetical protein